MLHLLGICCVPVDGLQNDSPAQVHFEGNEQNSKIIYPHGVPHGQPGRFSLVHNRLQITQCVCPKNKSEDKLSRKGGSLFTLYPYPVGMHTAHKRRYILAHLQTRALLLKPRARGGSSFSALIFSVFRAPASTRRHTFLTQNKWAAKSIQI